MSYMSLTCTKLTSLYIVDFKMCVCYVYTTMLYVGLFSGRSQWWEVHSGWPLRSSMESLTMRRLTCSRSVSYCVSSSLVWSLTLTNYLVERYTSLQATKIIYYGSVCITMYNVLTLKRFRK